MKSSTSSGSASKTGLAPRLPVKLREVMRFEGILGMGTEGLVACFQNVSKRGRVRRHVQSFAFDRATAWACLESATGDAAADPACSSALRLARERVRDGF